MPKKMPPNYRLSFPQNVELMETNKVSREKKIGSGEAPILGKANLFPCEASHRNCFRAPGARNWKEREKKGRN